MDTKWRVMNKQFWTPIKSICSTRFLSKTEKYPCRLSRNIGFQYLNKSFFWKVNGTNRNLGMTWATYRFFLSVHSSNRNSVIFIACSNISYLLEGFWIQWKFGVDLSNLSLLLECSWIQCNFVVNLSNLSLSPKGSWMESKFGPAACPALCLARNSLRILVAVVLCQVFQGGSKKGNFIVPIAYINTVLCHTLLRPCIQPENN